MISSAFVVAPQKKWLFSITFAVYVFTVPLSSLMFNQGTQA